MRDLLAQQHHIGFCYTGDKWELEVMVEECGQIESQEDGFNLVGGMRACMCQQ